MMRKIDKSNPLPLHYQLKELIIQEIESGKYKIGDKLPTEEELCERFDLSRITVRNTFRNLENMGCVIRRRSLGTFVSKPNIIQGPKKLKSFTDDIKNLGYSPSSKELSREVIPAPEFLKEKLNILNDEKVICLKRLRFANNEPMGIQETYLPYHKFKKLLEENEIQSLYKLMSEKLNIEVKYATETYRSVALDEPEAKLLKVNKKAPAFYVERIGYDIEKVPIEFVKSFMRADKYIVTINLFRE